jgi:hypothetical protein
MQGNALKIQDNNNFLNIYIVFIWQYLGSAKLPV